MYKPTTKLSTVLTEHPRAAAYLASINPHLKLLGNPVVIGLMAPRTDLRKVAERAGWTVEELEAAVVRSDTEGTAPATSGEAPAKLKDCLLYTSDAADDLLCVDLGGRRIIKKKKKNR